MQLRLILSWLLGIALGVIVSAAAQQPPAQGLPTFAELEAAGAVIGEVRVRTADVFDLEDPKESSTLYRWATPSTSRRAPASSRTPCCSSAATASRRR